MMLEDRYYHSPRTQLTPLVRSVQNSLDVRDKSVSGTDDDMEPTAIAPTLGAPGSSRVVSKTPPISAACYVPGYPGQTIADIFCGELLSKSSRYAIHRGSNTGL